MKCSSLLSQDRNLGALDAKYWVLELDLKLPSSACGRRAGDESGVMLS